MEITIKGDAKEIAAPAYIRGAAEVNGVAIETGGFSYLEQTIRRMVGELKRQGLLSEDFTFLTSTEQEAVLEQHIDQFLKDR